MITYFKRTKKGQKLETLKEYSKDCWIKVIDPNEDEIKFLVDEFKLEKENIVDGLDVYENSRIESDEGIVYSYLRVPRYSGQESTSSFLFVFAKNCIITIAKEELGMFDKLTGSSGFFTNKRTKTFLQILSYISRSYNKNVLKILKEVKKDKRNILRLNNKDILDLVLQEDILNDYLSSFSPLIDLCKNIIKIRVMKFDEDETEFIEDLIIDLDQTLNTCNSALKTISNMRDYYSTTLNHNLNKNITILTVFTIFLAIPTLLAGIYGMNIKLPFQGNSGLFWILSGIIVLIWIISLTIFKKTKVF